MPPTAPTVDPDLRGDETPPRPQPPRTVSGPRAWLLCLALIAPASVPYLTHYLRVPAGSRATGFIHIDSRSYMAKAREYFDSGRFRWTRANPYSGTDDSPRIYFEPWTLALGAVGRVTGWNPGVVFVGFGVVAAWACARVALALYGELVGLDSWPRRLGLVLFFWGGGLLALGGVGYSLVTRRTVANIFLLDPHGGWWFLNFGRNLIFPNEAFFHALFLGAVLAVVRRHHAAALAALALACVSHPFTGFELGAVLLSWSVLERVYMECRGVPAWFPWLVGVCLAATVGYHFGFLNLFPEHRLMARQLDLPTWQIWAAQFLPADGLVGGLALWGLRRHRLARGRLADPVARLMLVWFVVAFALSNHEFAVSPRQPLHFTRGYTWIPLFFLGAPALVGLLGAVARRAGSVGVAVVALVFLSDNLLWLGNFPVQAARGGWNMDVVVDADEMDLMRWLATQDAPGPLVLADQNVGYDVTIYTPLRAWVSHQLETPDYETRKQDLSDLFRSGRFVPYWETHPLLVILKSPAEAPEWLTRRGARLAFRNGGYQAYRVH